jgi:hypothetical protein
MWQFDAGDFLSLTWPLALISALLMRCDLPEPAATIAGFATTPFTLAAFPQFAAGVEQLPHTMGTRTSTVSANRGNPCHAPKWSPTPSRPSKRPEPDSTNQTQHNACPNNKPDLGLRSTIYSPALQAQRIPKSPGRIERRVGAHRRG